MTITPPINVLTICNTLNNAGFEAWLVGGAVRDSILGRDAHDWDIATNAKPDIVVSLFPKVIETGIKHGTVTVLIDNVGYEVTTFRGDGEYSDGRHPDEVRFCNTIEEDLSRRDFTMNAIAYNPTTNVFCDPFNGREDIKYNIIRAVGDPDKRFREDGLRSLRAIRFSSVLNFAINNETFIAIKNNLYSFQQVSSERVRDELLKILSSKDPVFGFDLLYRSWLLEYIIPELIPMIGCSQNKYHSWDVWDHTFEVVDALPSDPILRMAGLLHDVGKPASKAPHPVTGDATFYDHENIGAEMAVTILNRLKFSADDRDRIVHLVKHHFIRYEKNHAASAVRRWVRKVGSENVADLCTIARADIIGKGFDALVKLESDVIDHLENRIATMTINEVMPTSTKVLVIGGVEVMSHLGISPGPMVGKVLNGLLEAVTDNPENNNTDKLLELSTAIYKELNNG